MQLLKLWLNSKSYTASTNFKNAGEYNDEKSNRGEDVARILDGDWEEALD